MPGSESCQQKSAQRVVGTTIPVGSRREKSIITILETNIQIFILVGSLTLVIVKAS